MVAISILCQKLALHKAFTDCSVEEAIMLPEMQKSDARFEAHPVGSARKRDQSRREEACAHLVSGFRLWHIRYARSP